MSLHFDSYALRAHLAPVALAAAPAIILGISVLPTIENAGSILAFVFAAALTVLCGAVRGLGRKLEPGLWSSWGGAPTTQLLRWRGLAGEGEQVRRHQLLELVTGEALPTRAEEEADPLGADERYTVATTVLRARTRDGPQFKLVAHQNAEYGLRRNCLGLRPMALGVAGVVLAISAILFGLQDYVWHFALPVIVSVLAVILWGWFVTPSWVRSAAELYATRLMETVEVLGDAG